MGAADTEADARARDRADPLSRYRERFLLPPGPDGAPVIYLAGQSLGLQPSSTRPAVEAELDAWARLGVDAWFDPDRPWFTLDDSLRASMSRIVGARPDEVAILNTGRVVFRGRADEVRGNEALMSRHLGLA